MNQQLYILCGLPYAGKTMLARALASRFGWRSIAIDAINSERGLGIGGAPIAANEWDETYRESFARLDAALANGETVIYDAASFTRAQRDELRGHAARYGVAATVLYVSTPEALARQRWQRNRTHPERSDVRDDDFAHVVTHFAPPTADERVILYDGSSDVAEWIRQIFG